MPNADTIIHQPHSQQAEKDSSQRALDLAHLSLNSTLADLPTHYFEVAPHTLGEFVASTFKQYPDLPGVLISKDGEVVTVISRRLFLEHIGRVYGVEVYLNRPIRILVEAIGKEYLELPSGTTVQQAAQIALERPVNRFYEPIIVRLPDGSRRILDVYILLLGQTQLLRLVNEVEQNRRQLAESLQRTGRVLVSSLSLSKVTRRILKELYKVVEYERGVVFLRRGDSLEGIARRGFPKDKRADDLLVPIQSKEDDVFQRIMQTQEPVLIGDVTADPTWQQLDWLPINHSWLGVPLVVQDRVIGMISLTRVPIDAFSDDDVTLVLTFAGQAAIALENARLYEQILTFNDQLEGKVAERTAELNRAYSILEKLDKTKSDFIQVSAHELRTPLTIVKGYTQVLKIRPELRDHEDIYGMLNGIEDGMNRLHRVVNSMLDVAKIDSKTLDVYLEDISLPALITLVKTQLEDGLAERDLTLTMSGLEDLPLIQGDLDLLKKVFYSLLVNAVKYTPDGGKILVTGEPVREQDEGFVKVMIEDTGIGIDPDHHELIFEKFYQTGELSLHSSGLTKFMGGGPGLGLAIAKGIVEAHNGRIWVESEGRDMEKLPGSRFFVCLPATE